MAGFGRSVQGFLCLLQQLRIVLHDPVVMRGKFSANPIWADPVFARDDCLAFTKDVELSLLDVKEPEKVLHLLRLHISQQCAMSARAKTPVSVTHQALAGF